MTPEKQVWLKNFVAKHHSTPAHLLNSVEDSWDRSRLHIYEILDLDSHFQNEGAEPIGITSFQMITNHLAVRQKTIINKDYRRMGIGSKVLEMLEEEMRRFGVGKVISHVFDFNLPMIALLTKKGYKVEGYLRDHHAPGYHEYVISKWL